MNKESRLAERQRERGAQDIIAQMEMAEVVCRARGHKWPDLNPSRALPKSFSAEVQRDGSYQVTETCERNCGKQRTRNYQGGFLDNGSTQFQYRTLPESRWRVVHADETQVYRSDLNTALFRALLEKGRIRR